MCLTTSSSKMLIKSFWAIIALIHTLPSKLTFKVIRSLVKLQQRHFKKHPSWSEGWLLVRTSKDTAINSLAACSKTNALHSHWHGRSWWWSCRGPLYQRGTLWRDHSPQCPHLASTVCTLTSQTRPDWWSSQWWVLWAATPSSKSPPLCSPGDLGGRREGGRSSIVIDQSVVDASFYLVLQQISFLWSSPACSEWVYTCVWSVFCWK